ncbi:Uncharacterized protein ChrSV_3662 [Chromobacterium vaccinii]|nr:Uncharacterized protein ChrSW_3662 [Chromobacterium vaccinii]QND91119.1 Uncharacterized protein ChrSV_3662 [Chromobacterium vaccinii]
MDLDDLGCDLLRSDKILTGNFPTVIVLHQPYSNSNKSKF